MEMNLQAVYFIVGVAGLVLAAGFAVAAGAYFVKADIRAVRADLSGKARQTGLSERAERRSGRGAKNVLTKETEWQGRISHGDLAENAEDAVTASGGSDDLTDAGTESSETKPTEERPASANGAAREQDSPAAAASFVMVRSVVTTHSPSVIDASGNEVGAR